MEVTHIPPPSGNINSNQQNLSLHAYPSLQRKNVTDNKNLKTQAISLLPQDQARTTECCTQDRCVPYAIMALCGTCCTLIILAFALGNK